MRPSDRLGMQNHSFNSWKSWVRCSRQKVAARPREAATENVVALVRDVVAYRDQQKAARMAALDELAAESQRLGLY